MLGLMALLAPLPLPFSGVIGWLALSAFGLAMALFLVRVASATYRPLRPWAMNLLALLYMPVLVAEMSTWWRGHQLMRSLSHLILFALVVKLFSLRRERDYWHSLLAIFALFLAAMGTSVHPAIVLYLLTFLFGSLLVLTRFTAFSVLTEHGAPGAVRSRLDLRRFVAAVGAAALLASVPMFALLPRLRQPFLFGPGVGNAGAAAGGSFAGGLHLDTIGSVRTGRSVVLRFAAIGPRIDASGIRFKSATYDRFRRNTWTRGQRIPDQLERAPDGFFRLAGGATGRWLQVWQSKGGRELLLPTDTVALDLWTPALLVDDSGVVTLPVPPSATFEYKLGLRREGGPAALDSRPASSFDLEDSAVTPRMRELAAEVMGDGSARERARRLESYLMREHTYTLELGRRDPANPVEEFLFESRSGHCEYFATSMVLLLRSQGIPARMVSGYLGAEHNRLEGYYMVRQSNAHAWVEALVEGEGWRIFDPTPPSGRPQAGGGGAWQLLSQTYDYLLFRWDRYVLTYSLLDQFDFLVRARDFFSDLRELFGGGDPSPAAAEGAGGAPVAESGASPSPAWQWLVTSLIAVLGLLWLWRARAPWSATLAYRALRADVGQRVERQPESLAPLEVERRVLAFCPSAEPEARRIVKLYLEESFASRRLSDAELAELRAALSAVRKALREAA